MNEITKENKIQKSFRNSQKFHETLARAIEGNFDKELEEARADGSLEGTSVRLPLLKVDEHFTIRKHFSLELGADYYKLYKEKFYIQNPGSNYFETVKDTIYRSVVAQKEQGDLEWATRVGERMGIQVEGLQETPADEGENIQVNSAA